jgi:2-isopropylmalate synthase
MSRKIQIFDTTLRDGEQVPGAKLNKPQKLEIAKQLEKLGVDVVEAGFPCSSPDEFRAVQAIAREVRGPVIAALARVIEGDIKAAWEAVKEAERPRIHVFMPTSDIHLDKKLGKTQKQALELAIWAVQLAKSFCRDVEFSAEDATRSHFGYLVQVVNAVIRAGATVINIPDTVGYTEPEEFGRLISKLRGKVAGLRNVCLSVHCHNDLGLAVANSISAIKEGADQVECTINGIGERAGNAALEEIVMALKTRSGKYQVETGINTKEIYRTSRMVSRLMNIPVQPNKAIVGANAFAHSSGIHQDGILKDRQTYEIIRPEDVGIKAHKMVLTARSGRAALRHRLVEIGFNLEGEQFEKVYQRFIQVADRKKEVGAEDLISIVEIEQAKVPETFSYHRAQVMSGNGIDATATVSLINSEVLKQDAATGNGPVDAVFNCIERIINCKGSLCDYDLKAVTMGKDALGEATVRVEIEGVIYSGVGTSPDIIEASARAYLNAFNRFFAAQANGNSH